jgi:Flp pilus assembly protein TadG
VLSLRKFWSAQAGNTAIIFGLAVIPILALSGGAVDLTHRADIRTTMQTAADTAALAAARTVQTGQLGSNPDMNELKSAAEQMAMRVFEAALAESGDQVTADPHVEITEETATVSADFAVKTSFLGLIGIDSLAANAFAEVALPDPILVEIALVLDYSLSMQDNDKYIRMTNAAKTFIKRVADDRGDRSKIGIVPFSQYVYASLPGSAIRDTSGGEANETFTTCILNRDMPYAATDETPYSGIPGSRWPRVAGSDCDIYDEHDLGVRDLTDEFQGLSDALSRMRPTGLTNIALATEIGWHMLSPDTPFVTARDYADERVRKILIVLTDGVQTVPAMGPGGDVSVGAANQTTAELCTHIKSAGIRVFTIAYDVDDTAVYGLLSGCASSPGDYHEVDDASAIATVFDLIFAEIVESVWLSK